MINTPATTRPFSPISMPIDILRINPKQYSGFVGVDPVSGESRSFPTYQAAVEAGAWTIKPNLHSQAPTTPTEATTQDVQPTQVDKYIQWQIDKSKNLSVTPTK